jgi:hypothetical protein
MSDLSPLSGPKRKLDFGAGRSESDLNGHRLKDFVAVHSVLVVE